MLTSTQKQTAQSIINLFETGVVLDDYGNLTVITGDTGHLTFGRSQTTLGSGNLLDLLKRKPAGARPRCAPNATRPLDLVADVKADGIFGQTCMKRRKEYQTTQGLPATGAPDSALIAHLVN